MPKDLNRNHRNLRNSPYAFDYLAVTMHRSAAGVMWRWRTELAILTAATAALWKLAHLITLTWAAVVVGLALAALGALPWTRRRFWCVLARHRVHKLCWETRLHTRAGRLPLVLWARPTKVGERLYLLCRAGICAEDFDAHTGELRAACFARDARNPRWSQLVTIDIIRRDTLAPAHQVASPLRAHRTPILPPARAQQTRPVPIRQERKIPWSATTATPTSNAGAASPARPAPSSRSSATSPKPRTLQLVPSTPASSPAGWDTGPKTDGPPPTT